MPVDVAWRLLRPALFRLDAERAHHLALRVLARGARPLNLAARAALGPTPPSISTTLLGRPIPSPIGLAAGLDKDGIAIPFWPALGFGFIEVGTVTAHAQPGNPRPRLFRLPQDRALINRMGFNNKGSAALATTLRALRDQDRWPDVPVGANLGKSKVTPLADAHADYRLSARRLNGLADYFTVNVSSPNTPGLRSLQHRDPLRRVLEAVMEETHAPVLLKLSPDLNDDDLVDAVDIATRAGAAGIIATNTTTTRPPLSHPLQEPGGLSGRPLWSLAHRRVQDVLDAAGDLPVIGVGGVDDADKVTALLRAGCVAVQLYSSLIFEGPGLIHRLNLDLAQRAHETRKTEPKTP